MGQSADRYRQGILSALDTAEAIVKSYMLPLPDKCNTPQRIHASCSNNILEFILEDIRRVIAGVSDSKASVRMDIPASGVGSSLFEHIRGTERGAPVWLGGEHAPIVGTEEGSAGHSNSGNPPNKRLYIVPRSIPRDEEPKG